MDKVVYPTSFQDVFQAHHEPPQLFPHLSIPQLSLWTLYFCCIAGRNLWFFLAEKISHVQNHVFFGLKTFQSKFQNLQA